jgi:hypothetical protein
LTRTVNACPLYQKLYFWNEATVAWVDYTGNESSYPFAAFTAGTNAANTNIGKLTITAAKAGGNLIASSYWKPFKIYKVKITIDDQDSNGQQLLSYEF